MKLAHPQAFQLSMSRETFVYDIKKEFMQPQLSWVYFGLAEPRLDLNHDRPLYSNGLTQL